MTGSIAESSFRFSPPAAELPTGAAWALRRAFSTASTPSADGGAPEGSAEWAFRLGLIERIAARQGPDRLRRELGLERAGRFTAAFHQAIARNLLLRQLAALGIRAATERGIKILLLKGMALLEEIGDLDGARPLADVDLLAEAPAARELALALAAQGLETSKVHESAQHLPALHHPEMGTLEIHLHLPGVQIGGAGWARAEDILARGLYRTAGELAPALVPTRPLLAAHAVAHGLVQNAHSPAAYPLLRVAADLQDLAGARPLGALLDSAAPFLSAGVSRRELAALTALCKALARGTPPRDGSDAARVLDHVLAAHLDDSYKRALKVSAFGAVLRRGDWLKIRRRVGLALAGERRERFDVSGRRLFRVGWSWLLRRFRRGDAANGL